jgi:hypothetical protein
MGLLIDYFAAPSDDDAAAALETGPGDRFPATDGTRIEPVVTLGKLEELLTGKTFEQRLSDPASRPLIASAHDDSVVVVKLADSFVQALADAGKPRLDALAVPWSQMEELGGMADPAALADFLYRLQDLAETAVGEGSAIYCRICL